MNVLEYFENIENFTGSSDIVAIAFTGYFIILLLISFLNIQI